MQKELPSGIAIDNMVNALNSPESQQGYLKKLNLFLESIDMSADDLLSKTRADPRFVEFQLIKYTRAFDILKLVSATVTTLYC